MLVKPADLQPVVPVHRAGLERQRACDHLGEGRFAGAVHAEQADAVVDVEPQVEITEHRRAVIAHARLVELQQGRGERAGRGGKRKRRHAFLDHQGDRLELGQPLDARTAPARPCWPWP